MNFDASWKDGKAGAGFIICDDCGNVLVAITRLFYESMVPEAEFRAAWKGLTC